MSVLQVITLTGIHGAYTEHGIQGKVGFKRKTVNREYNGIMMCYEGKCVFTQNGKLYTLSPNTVVFLPKGSTYEAHVTEEGRFPKINFNSVNKVSDEIIEIPIATAEPYLKDYEYLSKRCFIAETKLSAYKTFYDILIRLDKEESNKNNILFPIIKFILSNFTNPRLDNEALARVGKISVVYLIKLFNEQYGMPPHRYILNMRLDAAKRILTTSDISINNISEQCGFSSPYHFSRQFKTHEKITPTQYRIRQKESLV